MTHDRATNQPNNRIDVGYRLKEENGHKLETLCVIDTNPRKISNTQFAAAGKPPRHCQLRKRQGNTSNQQDPKATHQLEQQDARPLQDLSIST